MPNPHNASIEQALIQAKREIKLGRISKAIQIYNAIIKHQPSHPIAKKALNNIQQNIKKSNMPINNTENDQINKLIELFNSAKLQETENGCRDLLRLHPTSSIIFNILGATLSKFNDKLSESIEAFDRAIELDPTNANALFNRACVLHRLGDLKKALTSYNVANKLNPNDPYILNNRGVVFQDLGKPNEAVINFKKSIGLKSDYDAAYNNLGLAHLECGNLEDATKSFRDAIRCNPKSDIASSNLLYTLNFLPNISEDAIFNEHILLGGGGQNETLKPHNIIVKNDAPPPKLKVGYISSDFKVHSIAYFFEPILKHHNRELFETYCYYNGHKIDRITKRLINESTHWRNIINLTDVDVVNLIKKDHIDILVDLNGHTANNRLAVFTHRPAPLQATWLGYPNTTGLREIDYRITDLISDPIGKPDKLHSEKLIRLPNGFLCYQGNDDIQISPDIPYNRNKYITFGSFNNLPKINATTINIWSTILKAIPESRLLLKSRQFSDEWIKSKYMDIFSQEGIPSYRIQLCERTTTTDLHLEQYSIIDIALDTFPYNGTTTTCEALWMGVPVIVMLGQRHSCRVGASILTHAGLTDYISASPDKYIELAIKLANDAEHLKEQRQSLREKLKNSPLCDAKSFTKQLEAAYKTLWKSHTISR